MELSFIEKSFILALGSFIIILGILGSILPVLPGFILSYIGFLIVYYFANLEISGAYPLIFGVLGIFTAFLNYYLPAKTTKKYGGTRYGSIGSFIGTLLGLLLIPLPIGFIIGMMLGVFCGELLDDKHNKQKAWNSTKGALLGFVYGLGLNLSLCFAMLLVVVVYGFRILI